MKVVFLDFDGVLNRGAGPWLPECVCWLNQVTNMTGAKIVVHSSWRYGRGLEEIREALRTYGAPVTGEVLDLAPVPEGAQKRESGLIVLDDEDFAQFAQGLPTKWAYERPAAIQRWLDEHPEVGPYDYVIFDDTEEMAHLAPRFLRTSISTGLTEWHAEKAIRLLKE